MTSYPDYLVHGSYAHSGYLDGLQGRDPNPAVEGLRDYDLGWLAGANDKDSKEKHQALECHFIAKGHKVRVPTGKAYKVTVQRYVAPRGAHVSLKGEFVPPQPAKVVWAGTGGYWSETEAFKVEFLAE
jgi:hypothetical protein